MFPHLQDKESTPRLLIIVEQLDWWLEKTVKEVQEKVGCAMDTNTYSKFAQVEGSPDHLVSVLGRIRSTFSDFHWTSMHFKDE